MDWVTEGRPIGRYPESHSRGSYHLSPRRFAQLRLYFPLRCFKKGNWNIRSCARSCKKLNVNFRKGLKYNLAICAQRWIKWIIPARQKICGTRWFAWLLVWYFSRIKIRPPLFARNRIILMGCKSLRLSILSRHFNWSCPFPTLKGKR